MAQSYKEVKDFLLLQSIQTSSGTHQDSYSMGPGDFFLGRGAAGIIELTTHLHLVLKLRITGAAPPPLLMTSWHVLGQLYLMTIKEFVFPPYHSTAYHEKNLIQ